MPGIVSKYRLRAARIDDILSRIVSVVAVGHRALFRSGPMPQSAVSIVIETANQSGLIDLSNLIARVVGVCGRRINTLVPIQLVELFQSSGHIHRGAFPPSALIPAGDDFASGTAATAIRVLARVPVRQSSQRRTTFPIMELIGPD